jgi:hypothetical protein
MKLLDANPAPRITSVEELSGRSNYFIGNDPAKWRNQGQTDTHVKFLSRGSGHTLFLTPTEAVVTLTKADAHAKRRISGEAKRAEPEMAQAATFSAREVGGVDEGGTCGIELRREYVLSAPKGTQGLDKTSPQFEARMTLRGGLARSTQRRVHDD